MADGLYAAAAGLAAQQTRLDVLANDLANVNTTGYKRARVGFRDLLYTEQRGVAVGAGVAPVDAGRSFAQGALVESSSPLSLAIEGPGFFQVRLADGSTALTRDGLFGLDAQGGLVAAGGQRLVPPVTVPKGTTPGDVHIAADGTVTVAQKKVGQIDIVDVPAPEALAPAGGNMFSPTRASGAAARANGAIRQGVIEGSNVDLAEAMTGTLEAQRAFELASRAVKMQDQLLEIANGIRR